MKDRTKLFIEAAQRCLVLIKRFNKVFFIGTHKTGTSSMQAPFQTMGLRVAPQHEGELHSLPAAQGNLTGLIALR